MGLDLGSSIDILRPIDVTVAMSQWHVAQEAGASIGEDPRSCPSSGAALCMYRRKLMPKYIGPFDVLERLEAVAYRLKFPSNLSIHPVFHVSLLHTWLHPFPLNLFN
jgi:hypothetical protein